MTATIAVCTLTLTLGAPPTAIFDSRTACRPEAITVPACDGYPAEAAVAQFNRVLAPLRVAIPATMECGE